MVKPLACCQRLAGSPMPVTLFLRGLTHVELCVCTWPFASAALAAERHARFCFCSFSVPSVVLSGFQRLSGHQSFTEGWLVVVSVLGVYR